MGFPDSSVGKESTVNAGDPGSIPGLGRSPEEGLGYPLQYSWASLVATHSSILAWRIPMDRGSALAGYSPWGCKELDTTEPSSSWSCSAMRGTGTELLEAALPPHEESLPGNGAKVRKAEPRDTAGGVTATPTLCCTCSPLRS